MKLTYCSVCVLNFHFLRHRNGDAAGLRSGDHLEAFDSG